jgi:ADP-heptose:LPS heptosyltransferase
MAVDRRPRVVALRALGLGDFLTGVPALRSLAAAYPEHRLLLAAPEPLTPLAALAGVELIATRELEALSRPLQRAELLVNLHGRGPQSHAVAFAARPRRLVAFANPDDSWSSDLPQWRAGEHEVARWCRLLAESGIPADPTALELPAPPGTTAHGATIIHPGAASAARRWPARRFAAVARAELAAGRSVVVTGSPEELGTALEVAEGAGLSRDVVLAGRTDLVHLAALVAGAGRVVCGDTGVAHLATAFGTPSVVLFGPTSPGCWGPPPDRRDRHRALWAGGTGDPHGHVADPGLLDLTVADVVAALEVLPDRDTALAA